MMEKIDIFGISPRLYFQGKGLYQTKCGSILTILTGATIILSFLFYGSEMFLKENPITVFTEEFIRSPEKFQFQKKNFNFAIGLQNFNIKDIDVHYLDESIYQLKFQMIKRYQFYNETIQDHDEKKITVPINSRRCKASDFQVQGTEEAFLKNRYINNLYCVDDYQSEEIEMEGDFGQDVYTYFEILGVECRNNTESQNCKSQEEINKHLNSGYWAMYYTDQILNPKNYSQPFQSIDRDVYNSCSNKQFSKQVLYFKNAYIESDTGLLWSNKKTQRGLTFSSTSSNTKVKNEEQAQFLNIVFRFEKIKQTRIFRSYVNLGAVLAQVGGLTKMALMTFFIFNYFFVQRDYHIKVLNQLYNFKSSQNHKSKIHRKQTKLDNMQDLKHLSLDISKKENIGQKYKDRLLEYFQKMYSNLRIGSFTSYFYFLFPKSYIQQEKKLLDIATQKLYNNLDVVRILTKLQEVDKLKELLLNKEQKQLFEYLPKPLIQEKDEKKNSEENNSNEDLYNDDLCEFEKIQEAFQAFKTIQSQNNQSKLDIKIMNLLDKKIRRYFELIYENNGNQIRNFSNITINGESPIKQKNNLILGKSQSNDQQDQDSRYNNDLDNQETKIQSLAELFNQKSLEKPRQSINNISELEFSIQQQQRNSKDSPLLSHQFLNNRNSILSNKSVNNNNNQQKISSSSRSSLSKYVDNNNKNNQKLANNLDKGKQNKNNDKVKIVDHMNDSSGIANDSYRSLNTAKFNQSINNNSMVSPPGDNHSIIKYEDL